MVLTFLQAKALVSPNSAVIPGSKEHKDILEMMRQSGKIFAEDNIPTPVVYARSDAQFRNRLSERPPDTLPQKRNGTSKAQWLSIDANRKAFDEHLKTHQQIPPGALVPLPDHLDWHTKIAPKVTNGMSKKDWVTLLNKSEIKT